MSDHSRVLIAEEGVKSFDGHWASYSAAIAGGIQAQGGEAVVAGHLRADPEVKQAMPFVPVFRFSRWDGDYEHRSWFERRFLVLLHNWRLYRDMSRFLDQQTEAFDVVFCGNLLVYHSLAWLWLTKRYLGRKFHRLTGMMIQPAGSLDEATGHYTFPRRSALLAWSLRKMHNFGEGRVTLATETPAARKEFAQLTNRPVTELHHPVDLPASGWPVRDIDSAGDRRVQLVCPGFARYEKGSDILLQAIRRLAGGPLAERVHFVLQWKSDGGFDLPDGSRVCRDEALAEQGLVTYLEDPLSGHDYWNFLAEADLLVLPYRRNPYTARLSRVTIEAMLVGRPVLHPTCSWLEAAVAAHGAGVGFDDGSEESLAGAISESLERLPDLQAKALARRDSARQHYSSQRFAERLLALGVKPSGGAQEPREFSGSGTAHRT